eukprot:SAG22_NODE_1468_length_4349_cov_2.069882_2_plen_237_part_00
MPAYAANVGPANLSLVGGRGYAVKMQFLKNATAAADAAAALLWSTAAAPAALGPIPASALAPDLPTASHAKMAALQRDQYARSAGWGSWFPYNLLQVRGWVGAGNAAEGSEGSCRPLAAPKQVVLVRALRRLVDCLLQLPCRSWSVRMVGAVQVSRLPDGAQLVFGLCQLSTGRCELESRDSANSIRLGPHAAGPCVCVCCRTVRAQLCCSCVELCTRPVAAAAGRSCRRPLYCAC